MERMKGVDAGYLYMETPTMHMHTVKVAILEREGSFNFDVFTREVVARLDKLPPFRKRILQDPLMLNHPLWIADREIDPARHIFRVAVPAPGSMRQLEELVGRVVSLPLDRSVPLWELHVCEDLEGGRVAVIAKLHHALADGAAANNLLGNATGARLPDGPPPALEPTPSRTELLFWALRDAIVQTLSLPALVGRTTSRVTQLVKVRRGSDITPPRPLLDVPRTSFNAALGSRRNFATGTISLDEVKAVKNAHGVTVNDVVLAVAGGALRRWMDARGEHIAGSLTAGVPVATDPPGAPPRLQGNRVSNLFTTLATDVDDPHSLRKLSNFDVAECDRELLILETDIAVGKLRVVRVERGLAVQHDDEVIAVGGNLHLVPLVGLEREIARRLGSADDRTGVVPRRLLPPDLNFVTARFLRRAHEHPAVCVLRRFELQRQDEILVALIRAQITRGLAASGQGAVDDLPVRGAGGRRGRLPGGTRLRSRIHCGECPGLRSRSRCPARTPAATASTGLRRRL
jgi:diacylglycerol O-acyltransferase